MRSLPLALTAILLLASVSAAETPFQLSPAVECRPRNGLPNFLPKLKSPDAQVRIAYLGGSITAQEGWRPKTLAWFQKTSAARVSQINAAIGGTGSDLGVFRVRCDVLDFKPDLLFIEFAVNDGGREPADIYRCMEGIVRQTWRTLPNCDICFVYTLVQGFVPTLQEGKFPQAASAMERIADHYGIPSIHMGIEVARLEKEGKLIFKAPLPRTNEEKKVAGDKIIFSPDGTHPYPETGHELYLAAIQRSWPAIEKASTTPGPHEVAAPFAADNFEDAKLIPINKAKLSPTFLILDPKTDAVARSYATRLPMLCKATDPGATVSFRFKGRYAAVYDVIGPECGQVNVAVDSDAPRRVARFDAYCTYRRLATLKLFESSEPGEHRVRIELDAHQPDKAAILARRHEKIDDPKRFDATTFYPGALLIVGDLET